MKILQIAFYALALLAPIQAHNIKVENVSLSGMDLNEITLDTIDDINYLVKDHLREFLINNQTTYDAIFMLIKFRHRIIFNDTINIAHDSYRFVLKMNLFSGFVTTGLPLFEVSLHGPLGLTLSHGDFFFFDTHLELLDSSCDSYLKSYYALRDEEYKKANKSELIKGYRGVFAFWAYQLVLNHLNYEREVCPLVFKGIHTQLLDINRQVNSVSVKII